MASNTDDQYTYETRVDPELICTICISPLKNPQCTPCDHIFCLTCIAQRIETGNNKCPICHQQLLSVDVLTQANRPLRNMLDRLKIKCILCEQSGLRRDTFDEHINKQCSKANTACSSADIKCPWIGARDQLELHLATCSFVLFRPIVSALETKTQRLEECLQQLMIQTTDQLKSHEASIKILQVKIQQLEEQNNQQKTQIDKDQNAVQQLKKQLVQHETQLKLSITQTAVSSCTQFVSIFDHEYNFVEKKFLENCPREVKSQVHVVGIHKIVNPLLESKYQQFVNSTRMFPRNEYYGWHGTSAKCNNGGCMSAECKLCDIVRHGFRKECARKNTTSYDCWGEATYFATESFVCHSYNGASQLENTTLTRCTILAKIQRGNTVDYNMFSKSYTDMNHRDQLLKNNCYDTLVFSRNYYIAPAHYLLLYNNFAALPIYIVIYSFTSKNLQIRQHVGEYCSFHNENHRCSTGCDGHGFETCLGSDP